MAAELSRGEARALVASLKKNGDEVVVNIGSEAAEHEAKRWPKAINVNIITKGRTTDIPILVKESGEHVDKIFSPGTVD